MTINVFVKTTAKSSLIETLLHNQDDLSLRVAKALSLWMPALQARGKEVWLSLPRMHQTPFRTRFYESVRLARRMQKQLQSIRQIEQCKNISYLDS